MNQKLTMAGVLAAVLIGGLFSPSQADQAGQVIYACTTPKNATVMRVSTTPVSCPAGTTPIQWGAGSIGPKGDKGDQGDTGLPGLQGPKGDKGDPGYSYEEALAAVNDSSSDSKSLMFGSSHRSGAACLGEGFTMWSNYNTYYCYRSFESVNKINFLSVDSASYNGLLPDAAAVYVMSGACPSKHDDYFVFERDNRPAAYLIKGQGPYSLEMPSSTSCIFTSFNLGYQSESGMYQVIYSATN